jgi:hypothetical protein
MHENKVRRSSNDFNAYDFSQPSICPHECKAPTDWAPDLERAVFAQQRPEHTELNQSLTYRHRLRRAPNTRSRPQLGRRRHPWTTSCRQCSGIQRRAWLLLNEEPHLDVLYLGLLIVRYGTGLARNGSKTVRAVPVEPYYRLRAVHGREPGTAVTACTVA